MQVYVKTDSYGGLDVRFPMSLKVLKKKDEPVVQQQVIENVRAMPQPQFIHYLPFTTDKTKPPRGFAGLLGLLVIIVRRRLLR